MKTYMNPDWLPVTQWMFTGSKVIVLLSFSHCAKQSRRLFGRAWPLSTWLFLSYVIMSLISLMSWSGVLVLPSVEGGQALGSACLWSLLVSRPSHLKRPVFKDQLKLLLSAKLSYIGYNNQALSRVLWSLVLASLLRWHLSSAEGLILPDWDRFLWSAFSSPEERFWKSFDKCL